MKTAIKTLLVTVMLAASSLTHAAPGKPTVVLVHGAFADSSSWNRVIALLEGDGFPVVAIANPLRSVKTDARYVADIVSSIPGPVVLVGHSYGGSVISEAAIGTKNVKALVYVAAFAPDVGETAAELSTRFPGSTLGPTLAQPVSLSGGGQDLYIQQKLFHDQFASDVAAAEAEAMAAGQRPITAAALNEASSDPAWKWIPAWFIYGDRDKNIPPAALQFMAERAHSRATVVVRGASHVVMVSQPKAVAKMIKDAAEAT